MPSTALLHRSLAINKYIYSWLSITILSALQLRMAMKCFVFQILASSLLIVASADSFYQDFDVTWGGGRAKVLDNGRLLTLSLDMASGSGFQSKKQYLFGKVDMQIKLVPGNSAGTVAAYYVGATDHVLLFE